MMRLIGVYGASGFGREVMPILRQNFSGHPSVECVFIDDSETNSFINGHRCMSFSAFENEQADSRAVSLAIADSEIRQKLAKRCEAAGVNHIDVRSADSRVLDCSSIGEGLVLCGFASITSNVVIGRHFHANIYSYVAHDCVIGDFVTFAPGVMCNGNVRVEDHVYIGTGAVIRQGTPDRPLVIGSKAIVGMGAVVTRDVPPGVTVVGNPAKPLIKD